MYKNSDFVRLGLRVRKGNRYVWMNCLKATADFYGWSEAFPTLLELKTQSTGSPFFYDMGRRGWTSGGGQVVTICRSPSTQGFPRGKTNSFRVSRGASQRDLHLIAQSTQVDWEWMQTVKTGRRPRSWWQKKSVPLSIPVRRDQPTG